MYDFSKLHGLSSHVSSTMKTPYQLDLEVKDRKPDIVPKVGDKVKIKSREWYEKWKRSDWWISFSSTGCYFSKDMAKLCGKTFTVTSVEDTENGERWCLGSQHYYFVPEMFEEVYPQELSTKDGLTKASDAICAVISGLGEGSSDVSAIPAINLVQGIGISYDLGTLSRQGAGLEAWPDTSPRTNLPQSCFGRISAVVHQDFFKKEEPELQTIKKHRFIKLEKL